MQQKETETQVTNVATVSPQQVVRTTRTINAPPAGTEPPQKVYQTKKAIFRTYQIIWYILGLIEVLLAFRILLKMLGANSFSGFTSLIYTLSNPLALPFSGILGTTSTQSSVFEWSSIIAGIVYAVIAYGIVQLIQLIKPTNQQEVEQTVDNQ